MNNMKTKQEILHEEHISSSLRTRDVLELEVLTDIRDILDSIRISLDIISRKQQ